MQNTYNQLNRIGYIDVMKGITIICVVVGHYVHYFPLRVLIWSFHMPLFVFLNGYFFKEGAIIPRIKKSFSSYIKPYIIVWLLLLLLELIIAYSRDTDISFVARNRFVSGFWALASNGTLYKPTWVVKIGVIWFLNALFIGSVLLSITLKIRNHVGQFFVIVMLFVLAMIQTSKCCLPFGINYGVAFLVWLFWGGKILSAKKRR